MNTTYEQDALKLLEGMHVSFKVVYVGSNCPSWDDEKHIHGDEYKASFRRGSKVFSVHFWNSYRDRQEGKEPTAYDVLACITKNDPGTFEDFCSELGYDVDSRKAEKVYRAVCQEWKKVSSFFTEAEIRALQEVA